MESPAVLVAGETLVDLLPDRPGPLASVERFTRRAGGAPANVAIALARLDRAPYFLTNVAEDAFGEFLVETLAENGVPDRFVRRDPDRRTTLAFVSHDETGDRSFSFYRTDTADTVLDAEMVGDDVLERVSYVSLGGVLLASEPARSNVLALAERAAGAGCTVAFDPNYRPELWADPEEYASVVDRMLELTDVVFASDDDVRPMGIPTDDPTGLGRALLDRGPHTVFTTLGQAGATVVATEAAPWDSGTASHPGYEVETVDTTGAGDAFVAGVLASLADGETDLSSVLAFANRVAALTTTADGAIEALPTRDAVAAFDA